MNLSLPVLDIAGRSARAKEAVQRLLRSALRRWCLCTRTTAAPTTIAAPTNRNGSRGRPRQWNRYRYPRPTATAGTMTMRKARFISGAPCQDEYVAEVTSVSQIVTLASRAPCGPAFIRRAVSS